MDRDCLRGPMRYLAEDTGALSPFVRYNGSMPPRKLTPVQVLERLLTRLEKRMENLQRVKLDGFQMVISELEVEQDYLRRAKRYLEE